MIFNMIGGGGSSGAGLNFKVVGNPQPSSPSENTIWIDTDSEITSWDFSATQPCRRSKNKNHLAYPFYHTTMTTNGITFTDNGDGTVKANGTATATTNFRLSFNTIEAWLMCLEPGTYILSGCASGGSNSTYELQLLDNESGSVLARDYGSGAVFTINETIYARCNITIRSGHEVSNVVFKPQLEKGSAATSFIKGDATGQVWISTGTSSTVEFNALKKNGIVVYPLYAKQYVGGAWVDKAAMTYKNGAWTELVLYLYNLGDQSTNISGGWTESGWKNVDGTGGASQAITPTVTWNDNYFHYSATTTHSAYTYGGRLLTQQNIDLTNISTIRFHVLSATLGTTNNTHLTAGVFNRNASSIANGGCVATVRITTNTEPTWYNIDVSALDGTYAVGLASASQAQGSVEADIDKIYMV